MSYIVYILEDSTGRRYKGVTKDLDRRLKEHRRGQTYTTRKMEGLHVIYTEAIATWTEARKRELYLKSAAGRRFINKILPG